MYLYNRASHCGHIPPQVCIFFLIIQRPIVSYIYIYKYTYTYIHIHIHIYIYIYISLLSFVLLLHFILNSISFVFCSYFQETCFFKKIYIYLRNFSSHTHCVPVGASGWNSIISLKTSVAAELLSSASACSIKVFVYVNAQLILSEYICKALHQATEKALAFTEIVFSHLYTLEFHLLLFIAYNRPGWKCLQFSDLEASFGSGIELRLWKNAFRPIIDGSLRGMKASSSDGTNNILYLQKTMASCHKGYILVRFWIKR